MAANAGAMALNQMQMANLNGQLGMLGPAQQSAHNALVGQYLTGVAGLNVDDQIGQVATGAAQRQLPLAQNYYNNYAGQNAIQVDAANDADRFAQGQRQNDILGFQNQKGRLADTQNMDSYGNLWDSAAAGGGGGQFGMNQGKIDADFRRGTYDVDIADANSQNKLNATLDADARQRNSLALDLQKAGYDRDEAMAKANDQIMTLALEANKRGISKTQLANQLQTGINNLGLQGLVSIGDILSQMSSTALSGANMATQNALAARGIG